MIHSSLYSSNWFIFYKIFEEQNIELIGKWEGKKRYNECYDRSVYKERAMPRLKYDILNDILKVWYFKYGLTWETCF